MINNEQNNNQNITNNETHHKKPLPKLEVTTQETSLEVIKPKQKKELAPIPPHKISNKETASSAQIHALALDLFNLNNSIVNTSPSPDNHPMLAAEQPKETFPKKPRLDLLNPIHASNHSNATFEEVSIQSAPFKPPPSIVTSSQNDTQQNQEDFQNETLLQIGESLISPIESCTGSCFLEKVNAVYREQTPSTNSPFISLRDLSYEPSSNTSLTAGISNSQLLRVISPEGQRTNIGIVKPALENFTSELYGPWQSLSQQRTGVPYTQMTRNEWLGSFLSSLYSKIFNLDFGVPETHILRIPASNFSDLRNNNLTNTDFNMICSVHKFIPNTTNLGTESVQFLNGISHREISKIAILDILLYNTDRRRHNLLVQDGKTLIPIDHSLIASSGFQDNARFFWLGEKGAHVPLSNEDLEGINRLEWSSIKKELLIANPNMDENTLNTLNASLEFLKVGASLGMTLYEIGSLMFRKGEPFSGGDTVHFAEHCYNKALGSTGDFSANIATEIRNHLTPCAQVLKDPRYKAFTKIPSNLQEGFRTPLLQAMMTALNNSLYDGSSFTKKLENEMNTLTKGAS